MSDILSWLLTGCLAVGVGHLVTIVSLCVFGLIIRSDVEELEVPSRRSRNDGYVAASVALLIPVSDENPRVLYRTLVACRDIIGDFDLFVIENSRKTLNKEAIQGLCSKESVSCFSIENKGNKAAALNAFLELYGNEYDYFAILDVDHAPCAEFLTCTLPVLQSDPSVALVQGPQIFVRSKRIIPRLYCCMQKIFFSVFVLARARIGFASCFGTNFVARTKLVGDVSWFNGNCLTEDTALAFSLAERGYGLRYINVPLAVGLPPTSMRDIVVQMKRYVIGNNQIIYELCKINFRRLLAGKRIPRYCVFMFQQSMSFNISFVVACSLILSNLLCVDRYLCSVIGVLTVLFMLLSLKCVGVIDIVAGSAFFLVLSLFVPLCGALPRNYCDQFEVTGKEWNDE